MTPVHQIEAAIGKNQLFSLGFELVANPCKLNCKNNFSGGRHRVRTFNRNSRTDNQDFNATDTTLASLKPNALCNHQHQEKVEYEKVAHCNMMVADGVGGHHKQP